MTQPEVCARVAELQNTIAAGVVALEISNRNMRVQALNERWNQLRSGLQRLLRERAKDMADVPGGQSGLLCREFKGKDAEKEIFRVDPGLVALLAELRAHERQAAEELGQWEQRRADTTPVDIVALLQEGRRRALARGANG
jgi:hypothetical protein